jgi:hypothetical protein
VLLIALPRTIIERAFETCRSSRARLDTERTQLPKGSFGILHLVHMIGTMQAACATQDYAWAEERLAQDWPEYLRAPIHGMAYTASIAHAAHARLLLNQRVSSGAEGSAARAVQPDLRELARMSVPPLENAELMRLRARCAYLDGDPKRAIDLLQQSAAASSEAFYQDEPERDRFALGCLLGGSEGAQLCATAEEALRSFGVVEPLEELRGFYPELFVAGLVGKVR